MTAPTADLRLAKVADIADSIRLARPPDGPRLGNTIFLIGAGCSISAGIPGASVIAKRMVRDVSHHLGTCAPGLDDALQTLGERESGTARLEEALTAYRAALEENTRDRGPLDWAATQYNLANVLATLSERTKDRTRMTEAIASMRNAAEVYRQGNVTYWLPIAEQRIAAMEATLAKMSP